VCQPVEVVAVGAALGLAFVLGISVSPNAAAALVVSRAASWHQALAYSFLLHAGGVLVGGTAVAVTVNGLVRVGRGDVALVYAVASVSAIAFVTVAGRLGIPASATYGMIGGLVGAALVAAGWGAIHWGGLAGGRPVGVLGVAAGLVLSPLLGVAGGAAVRSVLGRALARGTRRLLGPIRGGIWASAGLVAVSDGINDGQKAMGLGAGALLASGSLSTFAIPLWLRGAVAVALAAGTVLGGGRIIRRVATGYYRPTPLDALAAEVAAATVILGAAALGAPVSTSETVAASVVGAGADRHPRHVRWAAVAATLTAWAITVPSCAILGAVIYACATLLR
jgi:inorganic phosphate transporter, PiT family